MKNLILFLGMIFFSCQEKQDPPPVVEEITPQSFYGALQVSGTQLQNQHGQPVMLRGVSFGWHNWWPRFYTPSTVSWLKEDWKVNVVRASMGVDVAGAYFDNPDFAMEKIEAVIDAALANDLYVIIDWHSHHLFQEEAVAFFGEVAKKYGNHPHVIYEIFNEPVDVEWSVLKAYSEKVIQKIREVDPDNLILVGTPNWSQDVDIASHNPILGHENIMYVLHFYAGTHQASLRAKADKALERGLPIFVSECAGMNADGNGPIDEVSWEAWQIWMESKRMSWIAWSIADKDETCSMLYPESASSGSWDPANLKPWGAKVRSLVRSFAID